MYNKITDIINFLSKLSPNKILNGFIILITFYASRIVKKSVIKGKPVSISIEPTTHCNLRCPQCPSGLRSFSRATGLIDYALFQKIIDELHASLSYLLLYFQGEPYLHKDFFRLVHYANSKRIYTATSTNGHYLEKFAEETIQSGLDRLIISIDGADQLTYEKYRIGGNLDLVLRGLRKIVSLREQLRSRKPWLIMQFIVMKHNRHHIDQIKRIAKEVGVDDVQIKTVQVYDEKGYQELVPEEQEYARYDTQESSFGMIRKRFNHCWKMWHSCVFTWDGKVVPCCFDKDAKYQLGDISKNTFSDIWFNDDYQRFRKKILTSRQDIDICNNCSEGTNIYI